MTATGRFLHALSIARPLGVAWRLRHFAQAGHALDVVSPAQMARRR